VPSTNVLHGSKSLARVCKHGTKLAMIVDQGLKDYTHPWKQSTTIFIIILFVSRIFMYMHFLWFIHVLINLLLLLITYISK
jgi:hypothetical protein